MNFVTDQRQIARKVFTRSSESYATRKGRADRVSHEAMVRLSDVKSSDTVLEGACGPAFVGLLFAEKAQNVVGLDFAQIEKAAKLKDERGVSNLSIVEGDVNSLPFTKDSFDLVACHKAFHHFSRPTYILREIRRVLHSNGRLVLGDSLSSEDPAKSALHNEIEKLRDPSHVKMYAQTELQALLSSSGFKIERHEVFEDERDFDWWMSVINPPPEVVKQIRSRLLESLPNDGTGLGARVDGQALWLKRRSIVIAALRT